MRIAILVLAVLSFFTTWAQTPEANQLQQKRSTLQKEMNQLKESLDDIRKNRKASLRELAIMQQKLSLREENLKTINRQISLIQGKINNSQYEIARLAGELDTLKERYKKSVTYSYQHKDNLEFLNFVFSANGFNDVVKRIEYLKWYRKHRQEQAVAIRSTQLKLHQKIDGLQINRRQKDEVLDEQEKEIKLFAKDKQEKNKLVSSLRSREKDLVKELAAKEKAEKKLRDGINAAIVAEKEKERVAAKAPEKNTTSKKPVIARSNAKATPYKLTAEGKATSIAFEKNKGNLLWPVDGKITERFGRYKVQGVDVWGNNYGITLEMEIGANVQSVFDGEVLSIFDVDGRYAVIISHGNYYTTYSNLNQVAVSKGQKIETGQTIAKSAANDFGKGQVIFMVTSTGTHLNQDPEKWIRKR